MALDFIWAKQDERGRWVWGIDEVQAEKVLAGYACGNCLEEFMVGGQPAVLPVCPVCRAPASRELVELPQEWGEYIRERRAAAEGQ